MEILVPWIANSSKVLEHPQAHALVWPSLRKPHLDRNLHYNNKKLCKCITTVDGESVQSITLVLVKSERPSSTISHSCIFSLNLPGAGKNYMSFSCSKRIFCKVIFNIQMNASGLSLCLYTLFLCFYGGGGTTVSAFSPWPCFTICSQVEGTDSSASTTWTPKVHWNNGEV
jgi:hypothetical protein